ncbi:MAG TPA: septum site-determining protein Ssd [Propionicimonas sp.]|nr:septum site-determining protein Ssd [Propionicimonas sp.]
MAQLSPVRPVLVVAAPGDTQDSILAAVTAQELEAEVIVEPERLAGPWRTAATVIVADDQAEKVAARALPHREDVFLVGQRLDLLSAWSAPLAARVIPLPEGAAWLGAVLGEGSSRTRAPVVAVLGGSGGVGASTLAAALAQLSAARGPSGAALVDADPLGGGIDLLLGAERVQGWRWPRLNAAVGHLGDLRSYLPVVDGVSVVSMARGADLDLAKEPLAAIVGSLRAWHSMVVLDPGRSGGLSAREAIRLSSRQLVVVAASVRGVAAARELLAAIDAERAELVVRRGRGSLPSALVGEALGRSVVAEVPDEPGLVAAAERGEPPARGSRRRYRRTVTALVARLQAGVADG